MRNAACDDDQRVADLITANHILADQGILDAFGHISVRSSVRPSHFFQSRSRAPALVGQADIREFDENSEPVCVTQEPLYGERFIHGEVYRARADVQAVVHSHSASVIPFSVSDVPLRPLFHQAAFLRGAIPVFEIRDEAGPDNAILITNTGLGSAVARSLGRGPVVLMRGHGDTVVAQSLKQLVYRAIYTEQNARLVIDSLRLGGRITYLSDEECEKMGAINDVAIERPWEIWESRVSAAHRDPCHG
jgi:ribulose-5-phosphate 4-epimerase/fuculose-1-phosphate aldolase